MQRAGCSSMPGRCTFMRSQTRARAAALTPSRRRHRSAPGGSDAVTGDALRAAAGLARLRGCGSDGAASASLVLSWDLRALPQHASCRCAGRYAHRRQAHLRRHTGCRPGGGGNRCEERCSGSRRRRGGGRRRRSDGPSKRHGVLGLS
eukprot:366290-Chlamydomonas_euryale.AAC.7